ncbi:MAG: NAD-dependent epimerase/dehydratase family protein, partial [Chitinophagales bacterium]
MVRYAKNRMRITHRINSKKMKVLVTGGAGYIGSALVKKLNTLEQVNAIVIYDNL